ncbi:lactase/phlorizin hydrolase [Spea bombifrons]|uniref:lactase/phlorizin hydrolase n=1 Tax=Spea bombifrons TaxID=233779 RepID=UPI00234BE8E0|nr:lactase/phlorizin hydrolase [Spea bombifrons]
MGPGQTGILLVLLPYLCQGFNLKSVENLLAVAGPLPSDSGDVSNEVTPIVGCHEGVLREFEDQLAFLQRFGVTHYKVNLEPSVLLKGGHREADEPQVLCYRKLLQRLADATIKPVGILQGGLWRDWSSSSDAFVEYADFAFKVFGDLVHTWITFNIWSDDGTNPETLQAVIAAHERTRHLYRSKYATQGGKLSLALDPSALSACLASGLTLLETVDFVALNINYNCHDNAPLIAEEQVLQKVGERRDVLVFSLRLSGCNSVTAERKYKSAFKVLEAVMNSGAVPMGYDISAFQGESPDSKQRAENSQGKPSAARSSYNTVWDKFSNQTSPDRDAFLHDTFPSGFRWGASTAAFKVEGGWAEEGKGQTIWDTLGQHGHTDKNATANVASDSYHKIDYDVYLLNGLQTKMYQFSISWSRIFPTGSKEKENTKGVKYYNKLIDRLRDSGIEPMVALYHWDLPQSLQDLGGWQNDSIVDAFADYADYCFRSFGDRVKFWITFHEPWVVSYAGYGTGEHAPGIKEPGNASYKVSHNILKAHAKAWHVYNDKYRSQQNGQVGVSLNSDWAEPASPTDPEDVTAAERYLQFMLGWFAHPILINGDYPEVLKTQIQQKHQQCPNTVSPLPVFTEEERSQIRGTADFLGISHYTSRLVNTSQSASCDPEYHNIGDFTAHVDPSWPETASPWIRVAPWGFRRLLNFVKEEYAKDNVPIYITGNGMPTTYDGEAFYDMARMDYLTAYINEVLKAVNVDGVSVNSYIVRSLLDGFEGSDGYSQRFGLHYVDFENANRQRTPKESAYLFSNIIESNGFPQTKKKALTPGAEWPRGDKAAPLPASEVPSKAKVVWEKFSGQSAFERDMYFHATLPDDFKWGVSTSAYQVEGGWNADGRGPSVWDTFSHVPGNIADNGNGDIACDSYHQLDADLYMLRSLGVTSYRFSLSWSRIFPTGQGTPNDVGVEYYNRLIDGLLANNISPMVTLYHFDLPQALQDLGGWENDLLADAFHSYAEFCFNTFGDRVKFWITIHEPHSVVTAGYGLGIFPPQANDPGYAPYRVARRLLKAHAKVYHTYDQKYRQSQGGVISLSLNTEWVEPKNYKDPRDIEAADRYLQFTLGWFAHPIFKNGDYPDVMKWQVANKSELQGLHSSRLPVFTEEEKAEIRGTADVFCINIYSTKTITHKTSRFNPASVKEDMDVLEEVAQDWPTTHVNEHRAVAWGLRRLLNWIREEYGDTAIYITENGVSTNSEPDFDDTSRIFYFKTYIDEALKAHSMDGVNLKGYTAWSLMDTFGWTFGYTARFGLHHVDFQHPSRPRTPKRSAIYYADVVRNKGIPLDKEDKFLYGEFRSDFAWGVASSSYQIEGSWRADGKGLSIWDQFTHSPNTIDNDDTGDIACNSYNRVEEDIELIKNLKVTHYRFSISWPRVLPDGTTNFVNEAGLSYYVRLIDGLLAANIKPQVTIYHWDLPQALQDVGGWENETIVQRFKEYSELLFQRLGDKVKFWITHNEPYIVANLGYGYGSFAPGISSRPGVGPYVAGHNLIKSHAEVWHLYNDTYRAKQGGVISITINTDWADPINPYKQEDVEATKRYLAFFGGWFANPIFNNGDYHEIMKTAIRERSLLQGFPTSRLPEFTESEKKRIKGTYDFFGFNHYTSVLVGSTNYPLNEVSFDADRGVYLLSDRTWLGSGSSWLKVTPFGFRKILNWIKEECNNPPIYVTENGISERGTNLNDKWREHYYKSYVNEALKAVKYDGVDLRGYTAWCLMDNFEWAAGYSERFGLYYTNYSDPSLPRIPKESTKYYRTLIQCNGFPDPAEGPHSCLQPQPDGTSAVPTGTTRGHTDPITGPAEDDRTGTVDFLGLAISTTDAMIALYVEFSLLITAVLGVVLLSVLYSKLKKKLKRSQ